MPYEIRCYRKSPHNPNKYELVNFYPVDADSDKEAVDKAPHTAVQMWEISDLAILYSEDGRVLWLLKA